MAGLLPPAVMMGSARMPEGPQVVAATIIAMQNAPPKPAPSPAVRKGLPMGRVTP